MWKWKAGAAVVWMQDAQDRGVVQKETRTLGLLRIGKMHEAAPREKQWGRRK